MASNDKIPLEDHLLTLDTPSATDALALRYHKQFQSTEDPTFINAAILCAKRTLELCPADNPRKTRYYVRVASYLESRNRHSDNPDDDDLVKALEYLDLAAGTSGVGSETAREKAKRLSVVATVHVRLHEKNKKTEATNTTTIDELVEVYRVSCAAWEAVGEPDRAALNYHKLAEVHDREFQRTYQTRSTSTSTNHEKALALLDQSLKYVDKALQLLTLPRTSHQWVACQQAKANYLLRRAGHVRDKAEGDYRAAIDAMRMLMDYAAEDDGEEEGLRVSYQFELGKIYTLLASVTESNDDMHEAVHNLQRASEGTARDDPVWRTRFGMFQRALGAFITSLGGESSLHHGDAEIETQKEKVQSQEEGEGQDETEAGALHTLAKMHRHRYKCLGTVDDLTTATQLLHRAVAKTVEDEYVSLLARLGLAADCFSTLFAEDDDLEYLKRGLEVSEKRVRLLEQAGDRIGLGDREKGAVYYTMAQFLGELGYEEDKDIVQARAWTDRAIEAGETAVGFVRKEYRGNEGDLDQDEECQGYLAAVQTWREQRSRMQ